MDTAFFVNSALLGVGLAMDAFSVSLANGLEEPSMSRKKMAGIAGVFAGFQAFMPLVGWLCVHTVVTVFGVVSRFVPWVALLLLSLIGGKMIYDGARGGGRERPAIGIVSLLVQGVATSIDALSVGFTISEYGLPEALICTAIIAAVTFALCLAGVSLGRKFGTRLSRRASLLGGVILVVIGIEIFIKSFF